MKIRILAVTLILLVTVIQSNAATIVGFWKVTLVAVGNQQMTPVAKWFKNHEDGTFESGNGWTQNSYGTWTYDEKRMEFLPVNKNGVKDEFGPFTVAFSGEVMTWERNEEGMKVVVSLVPIEEMPVAPADQIHGLWSLSNVKNGDDTITSTNDSNEKQFIHIRPDRIFRLRKADDSIEQGFWHMNMHRPEFTLINYDRKIENKVFTVYFEEDRLMMEQRGEDAKIFVYKRIMEFPE